MATFAGTGRIGGHIGHGEVCADIASTPMMIRMMAALMRIIRAPQPERSSVRVFGCMYECESGERSRRTIRLRQTSGSELFRAAPASPQRSRHLLDRWADFDHRVSSEGVDHAQEPAGSGLIKFLAQ